MSDFDAVLERLLTDARFKAALAADPVRALAGYRLAEDERDLLCAQVSTDSGGDRQVEQRTSKASLFGLLGGATGGFGDAGSAQESFGAANQAHESFGPATHESFGAATRESFGPATHESFGAADSADVRSVVDDGPPGDAGGPLGRGITGLPGEARFGAAPPADYHPHVDVDGDGRWDPYTASARSDGGIDVSADMDHDGRADFVGHDDNRDGIIDRADYDKDGDGHLETHMSDGDGDGWMDATATEPRVVVDPLPPAG